MLPKVIVHNAVTVDGRIDGFEPDIGLYYELAMTFGEDAHLTGADTFLEAFSKPRPADMPEPEPVAVEERPLLAVPDSRGRLKIWDKLKGVQFWNPHVALCSTATPPEHLDYLRDEGVETVTAGDDHVDMRAALEALSDKYSVRTVLVDSGGTLPGVLFREGLVTELSLIVQPSVSGMATARSFFHAPDLASKNGIVPLTLTHVEKVRGDAVWLRYRVEVSPHQP
jgi:2,5-diamino-6-(ribosylamino)-4(3H)-pyrimidinone 5'-phosphate reductase